ncbi:sucrose hydrolase-like protein [Leishmania panamensis]|uniref:Sucrose-6-phosphate hydrolase n=2 Tax=Leishmania guyanensis species complex TaxID=38579 RepID=A0A088SD18_LEIPA|nr:sucrose hydrolase-like protein [Leishmania panamensis]AIN99616.1 sucrose hydrolase-like protein [Leishmania panamensis]CCM16816.1 Putative sucrose hydrolase-like protein [Leishmania guyanensis]
MSHEDRIAEANNAVLAIRKTVDKEFYPHYHISPYACSMNAPCGIVYFNGLYHVFYQHNPFGVEWGPLHWGHSTSDDMIHWRHHPIALAPGDEWDRDGCFSGSAVVYDDRLFVFYTGHHWLIDIADDSQIYQVQCLAISENGFNFEKRGIVVKPPAGFFHFRDPYVWFQDGRWWMVCGGRDSKDQGQLLLYSTDDLEDWDDSTFMILSKSDDRNVYMCEHPGFFPLQHRQLLMFSPQGMQSDDYMFRNRYQTGLLMGVWRPNEIFSITSSFKKLDLGHDFYGAQSFLTHDGRRVFIGWLDMWDTNMPTKQHNWAGMLSLPRVLLVDEVSGRIRTLPIKELENIRSTYQHILQQTVCDNSQVRLLNDCTSYEVRVLFDLEKSTAEKYGLWLGRGLEIYVDEQSKRLVVNRHYPNYDISGYRSYALPVHPLLLVHAYFDMSSVEVFVNEGEAVLSTRIYPARKDRVLSLFAVNGTAHIMQGDIWALNQAVMQ